jgi:gas vesicle protein
VLEVRYSKYSFSPAAKRYFKEQVPVISKKEAEMKEDLMLLGGIAVGLVAGVVIGAAVTALTVPQSGAETRRDIKDKKDAAIDKVKGKKEQVAEKMNGAPCCGGFIDKVKEKFKGGNDDDVVVEYTIRYDDDDEATVEKVPETKEEDAEKADDGATEEKTPPEGDEKE